MPAARFLCPRSHESTSYYAKIWSFFLKTELLRQKNTEYPSNFTNSNNRPANFVKCKVNKALLRLKFNDIKEYI